MPRFNGFTVYPSLNRTTEYPLWLKLVGDKDSPKKREWHDVLLEIIRLAVFIYNNQDLFTPEQWEKMIAARNAKLDI